MPLYRAFFIPFPCIIFCIICYYTRFIHLFTCFIPHIISVLFSIKPYENFKILPFLFFFSYNTPPSTQYVPTYFYFSLYRAFGILAILFCFLIYPSSPPYIIILLRKLSSKISSNIKPCNTNITISSHHRTHHYHHHHHHHHHPSQQ